MTAATSPPRPRTRPPPRPSTSSCRRWASRSPRAPCSSGPRRSATRSRPTRRSSRSRPTRSTRRSRRPPPAPSRSCSSTRGRPSRSGRCSAGSPPARATARPVQRILHPSRRPPRARPGTRRATAPRPPTTTRTPPRSRAAWPRPTGSTSRTSTAAARPAGSARTTCWPPSTARRRTGRSPRRSRPAPRSSRAPRRCSRATWTSRARSRPRPRSARSRSPTLDARRKQLKEAGHKVSFTHLIAYAIARAATEQMPVMARHFDSVDGKPHVIDDGACHLGIAVDVERKDGGRTLMVPVIRDAGRLTFPQFLAAFNELIAKARDNKLTADDLQGANVSLTNPGGIGTIASVPRLMKGQGTIVATGAIGYPPGLASVGAMIGAEKVMTMTSTYDHRIIQGAESGQFLQVVEAYLQGEHEFYDQVFTDLEAPLGVDPAAARAGRRRRRDPGARGAGLRRARRRGPPPGGPGRDLAAQGAPDARAPRGEARPARVRAGGRPGARPGDGRPDAGADGPDPGQGPADRGAGRHARRRAAAPARDVLRHDRVRDRAHRVAPPAHVAARRRSRPASSAAR